MSRKSKKKKAGPPSPPKENFAFNPFSDLKSKDFRRSIPAEAVEKKAPPEKAAQPKSEPRDEDALFLQAMENVEKIPDRTSAPKNKPPEWNKIDEEAEAQRMLVQLVNGRLPFDISDSDEFVEGGVQGLDRQVIKKLRAGEFSVQDRLDLHGMSRNEARDAVERFITDRRARGLRCVLLIHGRGIHSKDQVPVLKDALRAWLERGRGRIGGAVLAFSSARPCDGGLGAMYVLLRKHGRN